MIDKASKEHRGGNSALTQNMRFAFESYEDIAHLVSDKDNITLKPYCETYRYDKKSFFHDLMAISNKNCDQELVSTLVSKSLETIHWLHRLGHRWENKINPLPGGVPIKLKGGGQELQKRNFEIAEKLGVNFLYNTAASKLLVQDREVIGLEAIESSLNNQKIMIYSKAIILACGGFEANQAMRREYLGESWSYVSPRGVPFNTGDGINMSLEIGAQRYGTWNGCHASPQDASLPEFMYPLDYAKCRLFWRYSYPFGITVNNVGLRFADEGEDFGNLTYAKFGKFILEQPDSEAFQIFDSYALTNNLIDSHYMNEWASAEVSETLEGLAEKLGINPTNFINTINEYNVAVSEEVDFNPRILDGKSTAGITPPKSNWANKICTPPYIGFKVVCGITFTFGGIRINSESRVIDKNEQIIKGLFAAGEMIGGLFHHNYPGGSGMMAGAVFGRLAGVNAVYDIVNNEVVKKT